MPFKIGTHGAHGPVKPFEFVLPHFNNSQVLSLAWMYGPTVGSSQQTYLVTVDDSAVLLLSPPLPAWDEVDWQKFVDTHYSQETTEEDTGFVPIIPVLAWDEVDQQKFVGTNYSNQTIEEDVSLFPIISVLAWDEVDSQNFRGSQYSNSTQEEDLGAVPIVTFLAYEEEDQSKNVDVRQQQDDEPWHTFFFVPTPPPNLGWGDWDWNKSFDVRAYTQDDEPWDTSFTIPLLSWAYGPSFSIPQSLYNVSVDDSAVLFSSLPIIAYDEDQSKYTDIRQQQDDEPWHTFFFVPTPPPNLGWDDWDWSKNFDISAPSTQLEHEYWNPTLVSLINFFDEFEEQYNSLPRIDKQFGYSSDDEPWYTFFKIPSLAYDEDQSKGVDIRQQQDDEPWHTFFNIPIPPPNLGWDDWDWNKSFADVRQQQDDEPWQTFFIVPTPPPNLGWDDYDWCKAFQVIFSSQTSEEDIDSLPFISPFVFEEFNFYSGDDHAE
jgi:hypothetical protein